MSALKIDCAIKLSCTDNSQYSCGCYSYNHYNFLSSNCPKISVFNSELKYYTSFPTKRIYSSITYNSEEKDFFTVSDSVNNTIFRLNTYMEEIEIIKVLGCTEKNMHIKSISYNECKNNLLLVTEKFLLEVTKAGKVICETMIDNMFNNPTYSTGCYAFSLIEKNQNLSLRVYENLTPICNTTVLKTDFEFKCIVYGYYDEKCDLFRLYLLAKNKKCEYYLICVIIDKLCCKPECDKCICDDEKECQKSVRDILESIALMESALAHILNAEGEKLQKGICLSNTVNELICLNNSVEKTISKITGLETQLYSKLVVAQELYMQECDCRKDCIK
ncbi:MAG: hypothetical protein ACRCTZ_01385 [Sarcina sp.]